MVYRNLVKEGPWAVHLTLGDGLIFEVSVLHLVGMVTIASRAQSFLCGIKLARLILWLFGRLLIDHTYAIRSSVLTSQPFELHFRGQLHMGAYLSKY